MSIKTTSAALLAAVTLLAAGGCAGDRNQYDATGNFEATEVVVSSEVNGRILEFPISDGSPVHSGEQVGLIDSTQLHLQRLQVESNILALESSRPDIGEPARPSGGTARQATARKAARGEPDESRRDDREAA